MPRLSIGLCITAALLTSACGQRNETAATTAEQPSAAAPAKQEPQESLQEANKKVVLEFFRDGITTEERYNLIHPDYIQHNPFFKRFGEINGAKGREEFTLLMKLISQGKGGMRPPTPPPGSPTPPPGDPKYMLIAEGDLVTMIGKRYTPDPQRKGEFYESFWFDTWRLKDGKLYEHWDPMTIPDPVPELLQKPSKVD